MALSRIGCRDQLNVSSDSPIAAIRERRQPLANDQCSSLRSDRIRTVFNPQRIAAFPSPIFKTRSSNANPKGSYSFNQTPRHLIGASSEICNEHYSFSFSPAFSRGKFKPLPADHPSASFQSPMKGYWFFKNYVSKNPVENIRPSAILNPNKAVLVIDSTGKILTYNDMTKILFGDFLDNATIYDFVSTRSARKTIQKKLHRNNKEIEKELDISTCSKDSTLPLTFEEDLVDGIGKVVFSGEVISIDAHDIGRLDVSLWMQRVTEKSGRDPRWITILEPIKISVALASVNLDGVIVNHDSMFRKFFGFDDNLTVDKMNIFDLISSLKLPDKESSEKKLRQKCAGHTLDGVNFPLAVSVTPASNNDDTLDESSQLFHIKLKMFCHIGGLVVLDANGAIVDYNRSFIRLLFGYSSSELKNCHISELLPNFNQASPSNITDDFFNCEVKGEYDRGSVSIENLTSSNIPYMDESVKENSFLNPNLEIKSTSRVINGSNQKTTSLSLINSEESSVSSPNKARIITDSQFTINSTNMTSNNNTANQKSASSNLIYLSHNALDECSESIEESNSAADNNVSIMKDITNSLKIVDLNDQMTLCGTVDESHMSINLDLITSTPTTNKYHHSVPPSIEEGSFLGVAKHKDGSAINVLYQIRHVVAEGKLHFCLWMLWEPDACQESIAETSRIERQSILMEKDLSKFSNGSPYKSLKLQETSISESHSTISSSSFSSRSQVRHTAGSSPFEKSSMTSFSHESLSNGSSVPIYDLDSPVRRSSINRSLHKQLSSTTEGSDNETTSPTYTEGSSEDEYSIGGGGKSIEKKRRSFSENDVQRLRRDTSDFNESAIDVPDEILGDGEFQNHYTMLRSMGKGAFGYVKMCYRHTDGLLVSTKFITKSQVFKDSWVKDKTGKKLPLEVIFLLTIDHPHIVKAYEYFENDLYIQLVTEKWGAGMDLFEFIERNPAMDEPLASYIFRQIVSALLYLRSNNILHHDIKDENIIINHEFHVKLIDFGSASYWYPNSSFSNFAGTVEYCSPEVIDGGSYNGKELEVWSLGITLYTLMFGENPFSDMKQVSKQELVLPVTYSNDFSFLLHGMLDKNPETRLTLAAVAEHQWTNQPFDLANYPFEDIVSCTPAELNPPKYLSEYGDNEESMSTTSSSFVYENHHSLNVTGCKDRSALSASTLESHRLLSSYSDDPSDRSSSGRRSFSSEKTQEGLNSSRTSTSQSTVSLRSTVTIDSSILIMSPSSKKRERSHVPSNSSESTDDISSELLSEASSRSCDRHSSLSSDTDSTNSFSQTTNSTRNTCDSAVIGTASFSSVSVSPVPTNNSSSSSLVRQRSSSLVSTSSSDDDTLNTDFNAILTDDKGESELGED